MKKYEVLVNILDKIRKEAVSASRKTYCPDESNVELVNHARSRAFIHLFLKVNFGLLDFYQREHFVTDNSYDGGIDGYYINKDNKVIYFIQSKFRTNQYNFENKGISVEEILVMDIDRITSGELKDENGNDYNGKIKQLIREISELEGISRYKYKVIILANLEGIVKEKIRKLTGGYDTTIFDFDKCYSNLVFPVISGTYFNASDLNIFIDLSNKNAGSKISYTVQTKRGECEITVLFIPTIEIAKILHKYKNSILKYNPRSYLEHEGQQVNEAIRATILSESTNEFALFNNGITMLSDETYINERIGQRNKAQLTVKNPQIINGGQTAFTLSKIYEENLNANVESVFANKEVLIKIITFINDSESSHAENESKKLKLIDEISTATNRQTAVINADKFSNDDFHKKLQSLLFDRFGLLYERKRGEFGDGINQKYIKPEQVLERNLFFRIFYAASGKIEKSINKRIFLRQDLTEQDLDEKMLNQFFFGYLVFTKIYGNNSKSNLKRDRPVFSQIYIFTKKYMPDKVEDFSDSISKNYDTFLIEWKNFLDYFAINSNKHKTNYFDKSSNNMVLGFNQTKWFKSHDFEKDMVSYFENKESM